MYGAIRRIPRIVSSPTLATAAQDNLSDVLTSVRCICRRFRVEVPPPVGRSDCRRARRAVDLPRGAERLEGEHPLFDRAGAAPEIREKIAAVAAMVPGVLGVHQVITEYVGPRLVADLHIDVDGHTPLFEVHRISDEVRVRLETLPEVDRVYVHVEPCQYNPDGCFETSGSQV